tara:strand:- start:92 stop:667 length:576 start_codon:yes stop_codon:yes gene_type:complete
MIIGLVGKKNVGKDLVASFFESNDFIKLTFASTLKEAVKILFNWSDKQVNDDKEIIDPNWNITPREILQLLGTEFLRFKLDDKLSKEIEFKGNKKDFSFHIKDLFLRNIKLFNEDKNIVISDVRFIEEYNFIKWLGGKTVKINRNVKKNEFSYHISETQLDQINDFDFTIENNFSIGHLNKIVNILVENHC